ncbi:MAG: hypothetical protein U0Q16_17705 [Bryobacteraceae bacterium]
MDASKHPYKGDLQLARKVALLVLEAFLSSNQSTRKTYRSQVAKSSTYPSEKVVVFCLLRDQGKHVLFYEFLQGDSLENVVRKLSRGQRWEALPLISRVVDGPQAKLEEAAANRKQLSSLVRSHLKNESGFEVVDIGAVSMPDQSGLKMQGAIVVTDDFVLPEAIFGGNPDAKSPVFNDAVRLFQMLTTNHGQSDGWITALWRLPGYPADETDGEEPLPPPPQYQGGHTWVPRAQSAPAPASSTRPPAAPNARSPRHIPRDQPVEATPDAAAETPRRRKTRYTVPQSNTSSKAPWIVAAAAVLVAVGSAVAAFTGLLK